MSDVLLHVQSHQKKGSPHDAHSFSGCFSSGWYDGLHFEIRSRSSSSCLRATSALRSASILSFSPGGRAASSAACFAFSSWIIFTAQFLSLYASRRERPHSCVRYAEISACDQLFRVFCNSCCRCSCESIEFGENQIYYAHPIRIARYDVMTIHILDRVPASS